VGRKPALSKLLPVQKPKPAAEKINLKSADEQKKTLGKKKGGEKFTIHQERESRAKSNDNPNDKLRINKGIFLILGLNSCSA